MDVSGAGRYPQAAFRSNHQHDLNARSRSIARSRAHTPIAVVARLGSDKLTASIRARLERPMKRMAVRKHERSPSIARVRHAANVRDVPAVGMAQ
jgi:hypothetical protein